MPEGALKRQMLTELTRLAGLPEGELQGQWTASPASSPAQSRQDPGRRPASRAGYAATRRAPRRPEDRIVQLLLMQAAVAQWGDDGDDSEADFSDLRRLLDGRLLESLGAQQRALAEAVATDPTARETFQRLFERMRQLKQRLGPGAEPAR